MKYLDKNLPIQERIDDLVPRMTVDEKLDVLDYDYSKFDYAKLPEEMRNALQTREELHLNPYRNLYLQRYAKEYTRLQIPFLTEAEALHGLCSSHATIFPQALTLSSSFDPDQAYEMGKVIGAEALAVGVHEVWTPVCDLAREPRYGRTEETYGEDDYLASRFTENVVRGIREGGKDKVLCELKHFTGYANPLGGLNSTPSTMGRHEIYAYCTPVFKAAIDAGAVNVMNSYNSIDGVPVVMDHALLTDQLRGEFHMPGFVRADMTSICMLHDTHFVAATKEEALRLATKAGVDVQLADFTHEEYRKLYKTLLADGGLTQEDLDTSVRRVLYCLFRAGLFDDAEFDLEEHKKVLNCAAHKNAALTAARKSVVLLKNDGILPLNKKKMTVAVIGPNAESAVMGDYCAEPKHETISLLDGLKSIAPEADIIYERGCAVLHSGLRPIERWWTTHSPRPCIVNQHFGLTGEYFNNHDLSGEPVLTRFDPQINFNWINEKPDAVVDANAFSVRWTGRLNLGHDFNGRLGFAGDDSVRMYLDGELLIDDWDKDRSHRVANVNLKGGSSHDLRIEFKNDARAARVMFGFDFGEETFDKAIAAASKADMVILALGDSTLTSGENFDRTTLDLAGAQGELMEEILKLGRPTVLVLSTGRPVTLPWADERLNAVLQAGFIGEQGGTAIAEALFGDINPGGRLTMSYPRTVGQIPCHYSRTPAGGKRYVEMDWNPQFSFGYGLSYTTFAYSDLRLSAEKIRIGETVEASFDVKNTGDVRGDVCPQLYLTDIYSSVVLPIKQLRGFTRVTLEPGESRRITFTLNYDSMKLLNAKYEWVVEPGAFRVMVGDNAADTRLEATFEVE